MNASTVKTVGSVSSAGRERLGRTVASAGRDILVLIDASVTARAALRVGDTVVVGADTKMVVGTVSGLKEPAPGLNDSAAEICLAQIELVGTLGQADGEPAFSRAVASPPALGDVAYAASAGDLRRLFRNSDQSAFPIGKVLGAENVVATIDASSLVGGGFAVLGGRNSGKSCTMASLVRALLRHRFSAKAVLIDQFNEYSESFGKAAEIIGPEPSLIPHWLLSFDELQYVLSLNGGPLDSDEISILAEAVPAARVRFRQRNRRADAVEPETLGVAATVEAPIPYRMLDVLGCIDRLAGIDEQRDSAAFRRLRTRVTATSADPRLSIFFGDTAVSDNLEEVLTRLFRLRPSGPPMCVLQLGDLEDDIDRVVVSLIARVQASIAEWGGGEHRTLLLIESIDRYAPAEALSRGAELSRAALRALGGRPRKLGTTLGITVNEARKVDQEIFAQCSTFFVHRLSSDRETEHIQDILPEPADGFLVGCASLDVAETVAVGRGVPLTGRIKISPLPEAAIPSQHRSSLDPPADVAEMIRRWRSSDSASAKAT